MCIKIGGTKCIFSFDAKLLQCHRPRKGQGKADARRAMPLCQSSNVYFFFLVLFSLGLIQRIPFCDLFEKLLFLEHM